MENLDGAILSNSEQWKCDRNKNHILGAIERVQESVILQDGTILKYYTKRLIIFHVAVDLDKDVPEEIEVSGFVDGRMLSMVWKCSVPGCGCIKEWHPDKDALDWLRQRYAPRKAGV